MAINSASLGEQIEDALKEEILLGKLKPGQRLSLDELAKQWGVSSMPVRDAVKRLEISGFLKVAPRRGVFVSQFDKNRFRNILDIRIALEKLGIELATDIIPKNEIEYGINLYMEGGKEMRELGKSSILAQNDNYVHDLIFRYCHNSKLVEIMNGLQDLVDWCHKTVEVYRPDALEKALPEHIDILKALKARDVEGAKEAMQTHLKGTLERTFDIWTE